MIIGNGMIAKSMKKIDNDLYLYFCSGVANSNEIDENEYIKEKKLLTKYCKTDKKLIYFSSYFVNFEGYLNKRYYRHKLEMENFIKENFNNFIILRLPQVVGFSKNKNTLTNFLSNAIKNNHTINVYQHTERNLFDIDDISNFMNYIHSQKIFHNEIINLVGTRNYSIEEIIITFEKVLNKKAHIIKKTSKETKFDILLSEKVLEAYKELNIKFDSEYLYALLKKYYKEENNE